MKHILLLPSYDSHKVYVNLSAGKKLDREDFIENSYLEFFVSSSQGFLWRSASIFSTDFHFLFPIR